ncbi:MAG: hypothetical protein QOE97_689 [Pseudonocardiales bacterium]|jgi:hypothetical protein|nr:hypothetical protein [Pseudonocardiales bacterium]
MLFADGFLGLALFGLWLFCIIDVISSDESQLRNLPKAVWLIIVILLFDIGALLWLVAGRNWQSGPSATAPRRPTSRFPEYDRPGRQVPANPDDDEEFLRGVRERAEQQRREYQARREAELQAEQDRVEKRPEDE